MIFYYCPSASCTKELQKGQYYDFGCEVKQCTNAVSGQYYTASALGGSTTCPVASCTQKLEKDEYFSSGGGTSPTSCKTTETMLTS